MKTHVMLMEFPSIRSTLTAYAVLLEYIEPERLSRNNQTIRATVTKAEDAFIECHLLKKFIYSLRNN